LLTPKQLALDLERAVKFKCDVSTFFYARKDFTIIQDEPKNLKIFKTSVSKECEIVRSLVSWMWSNVRSTTITKNR